MLPCTLSKGEKQSVIYKWGESDEEIWLVQTPHSALPFSMLTSTLIDFYLVKETICEYIIIRELFHPRYVLFVPILIGSILCYI
jgi:hypothetical protein